MLIACYAKCIMQVPLSSMFSASDDDDDIHSSGWCVCNVCGLLNPTVLFAKRRRVCVLCITIYRPMQLPKILEEIVFTEN